MRHIGGPLEGIRVAVADAEGKAIPILHGDWGVLYGETTGAWVADERHRPFGVSPLGAVVLFFQPARLVAIDSGDPMIEAAEALGVNVAWAEGFADGFDNEASGFHLAKQTRRLYLSGLEAGMAIRFELTVTCRVCGSRHFRRSVCPLCEERRQRDEANYAS